MTNSSSVSLPSALTSIFLVTVSQSSRGDMAGPEVDVGLLLGVALNPQHLCILQHAVDVLEWHSEANRQTICLIIDIQTTLLCQTIVLMHFKECSITDNIVLPRI